MIAKPSSCVGCPLYAHAKTGFSRPDGQGHYGVMIVAEALGAHEEDAGVPLVGKAGLYFFSNLARVGLERDGFIISNVLQCFTNPRTSVLTSTGYRPISSLHAGDLVLTHRGRFRPITATHFQPTTVLPHYIVHLSDGTQHGVTNGHGWIHMDGHVTTTEHLQIGMEVPGICEVCTQCGNHFHRKFKPHSAPYCSRRCFNQAVARGSRDKVRQAMLDQYKSGSRDPFKITAAANAAMRELIEQGAWAGIIANSVSDEGRRQQRLRAAMAREALGIAASGHWIGHGEHALHDLLTAAGYNSIPQFALEGFNYDFKVGSVLVEVDNPDRDCQKAVKDRQEEKNSLAKQHGYTLIRVPSNNVGMALTLLKNDSHDYEFSSVSVEKIERRPDRAGIWSCEVAEDASYVVKGIAHHNCRPPENKLAGMPYEAAAIAHCAPNLDHVIDYARGVATAQGRTFTILTLGRTAFKRILGLDEKRDARLLKEDYLCYPFWSEKYRAWVVAADHPSYLMRGQHHLIPVMQFAATRAVEIARDGLEIDQHDHYLLDPPPGVFQRWVDECQATVQRDPQNTFLSYDIETPMKQGRDEEDVAKEEDDDYTILRCSFCYRPGEAVSIPWRAEYFPALERIFTSQSVGIGWNNNLYDDPRIKAQIPGFNLTSVDGMLAWHVLNSAIPKGLGFVTPFYAQHVAMWKHLSGAEPAFYSAKDADMALRCWLGIQKDLDLNHQGPVFKRHVIDINRVYGYMSQKGIPLDRAVQQEAEGRLEVILTDLTGKMEAVIPDAARDYKVYQRTPEDTSGMIQRSGQTKVKQCPGCGHHGVKADHFKSVGKKRLGTCRKCGQQRKKHCDLDAPHEFIGEAENPCCGLKPSSVTISAPLWARPLPFKISTKSLLRYQQTQKHQAVLDPKSKSITFDEKAMMRLMKKYPSDALYPTILDYRANQKLLSTYIQGIRAGKDGNVHCTLSHNPSTLRSACQNPNLQNLPRPKGPDDLATYIRSMFMASPGHVLLARDFSGIEAVLVGYFAHDPGYIRLATHDVHSFYTAYALHALDGRVSANDLPLLAWDDDKLFSRLAEIKKEFKQDRNTLYKHLVHAANFMQGAKGAAEKILLETGQIYSTALVQRIMDIYFELFPLIRTWHKDSLNMAERDGYLRNPFGYVHRFLRVREWSNDYGHWEKTNGPDANKVVAFLPQSTAAGIIKEAMLRLYETRFDECGQFLRLLVHDELFLDVPERVVDTVDQVLQEEMERPITALPLPESYGMGEYLAINTEAKRGPRWGEMR